VRHRLDQKLEVAHEGPIDRTSCVHRCGLMIIKLSVSVRAKDCELKPERMMVCSCHTRLPRRSRLVVAIADKGCASDHISEFRLNLNDTSSRPGCRRTNSGIGATCRLRSTLSWNRPAAISRERTADPEYAPRLSLLLRVVDAAMGHLHPHGLPVPTGRR
jgi:hypothetical protein